MIEARVSTEKPDVYGDCRVGYEAVRRRLTRDRRHLLGAFAAMLFVGASWGANAARHQGDAGLLRPDADGGDAHGRGDRRAGRAARGWSRGAARCASTSVSAASLLLGLMMGGFFAFYALGIQFSNPITAAAVQVAGPLVAAVDRAAGHAALRFDPGFGVALALTLLGGLILLRRQPVRQRRGDVRRRRDRRAAEQRRCGRSTASRRRPGSTARASSIAPMSPRCRRMGWLILSPAWPDRARLVDARRSASATAGSGRSSSTVAVLASGLGGYFWNVGASRLGVAVASLWVNLVPFFAVLWSMAYGFVPNAYQIVGGSWP